MGDGPAAPDQRGPTDGAAVSGVRGVACGEGEMTEPFVPFDCPYCGVPVRAGDQHAQKIDKKAIKDGATIIVTCILQRTFSVKPEEVK